MAACAEYLGAKAKQPGNSFPLVRFTCVRGGQRDAINVQQQEDDLRASRPPEVFERALGRAGGQGSAGELSDRDAFAAYGVTASNSTPRTFLFRAQARLIGEITHTALCANNTHNGQISVPAE